MITFVQDNLGGDPAGDGLQSQRRHRLFDPGVLVEGPGLGCLEEVVQARQLLDGELGVAGFPQGLLDGREVLLRRDLHVERAVDRQDRALDLSQHGGRVVHEEETEPLRVTALVCIST